MENFDFSRFFKVLSNSKLYVFFVILLFLVMGYFYSFYYVTPMYKSSATVVLIQNDNSLASSQNTDSITQSDITLNQNLLSTYTKIAKSDKVLEQVIDNLNLNISVQTLKNLVTVQSINSTEIFKISVDNENNFLAASITNELLNVFSAEVESLYNMNNVYIMDMAEPSETPFNINHTKDITMFGIIGFVAAFGLVVLIYLFDTTIKSEQDVEEYAKLNVLSTIPIYNSSKKFSELITNEQPISPISECFKTFRTNVMYSIQNKELNTILVTSGFMGEGKSFVSSNLAVTFAQSGKKVILVDTDMRKGRAHKIFNVAHKPGLSNCLSEIIANGSSVNINNYIQKTNIPNLHIMSSGVIPPNPSELISSPYMRKFLEALNTQYDVVICDGTPCMLVSDSVILSKFVDTTVIVTSAKVTKLNTLTKLKKSIEIVGGNIGGVVINRMSVSTKSYKNGYYYGNRNSLNRNMDLYLDFDDSILDNILCIDDTDIENTPIVSTDEFISTDKENFDFGELSDIINDNTKEIMELRGLYKNMMQSTLDSISKNDNSSIIEELSNIKKLYSDNVLMQNEQLSSINEQISNINVNDDSSDILNKLENIKSSYEQALSMQNEQISSLDTKISNININDNSNDILNELENIKSSYEQALSMQNEQISNLDAKISNIDFDNNSDTILDELNNIRCSYAEALDMQNKQISDLNKQLSNIVIPDDSELLREISNIYTQLEKINSRFDLLEKKALNNEILLNTIGKTNIMTNRYTRSFDIRKLNDKVIKIQDYLENNSNTDVKLNTENILNSTLENNNDVLDERIDLTTTKSNDLENTSKDMNYEEIPEIAKTDKLLDTIDEVDTNISKQVNNNVMNNKPRKGFSIFKSKHSEPVYEEPVNIVSQILSRNNIEENVG